MPAAYVISFLSFTKAYAYKREMTLTKKIRKWLPSEQFYQTGQYDAHSGGRSTEYCSGAGCKKLTK